MKNMWGWEKNGRRLKTTFTYPIGWGGSAERALEVTRKDAFDIAVIDIGLPAIDGLALTQALREQGHTMPVLILTARDALQDRVQGLDKGADDYMVKPFELPELLARLRALLRRSQAATSSVLRFGPLELDMAQRLASIQMVMVAAREHPLASYVGVIPKSELAKHVQLVLTDRSSLSKGREFGVLSPQTWRLADLFAKHAFLLNALGWGGMPLHAVKDDLAAGRLVELRIEDVPSGGLPLAMAVVYPTSAPPGPAGRWLIERMKKCEE